MEHKPPPTTNGDQQNEEKQRKEEDEELLVDQSLVNRTDNLASKNELEAAEAKSESERIKFLTRMEEELNEESLRFLLGQQMEQGRRSKQGGEGKEDQQQQEGGEQEEGEEEDEEMPYRWRSLNDLSDGLPAALIITNLPNSLFVVPEIRAEFESVFTAFDSEAAFQYFRSFKRCRVNFTSSLKATLARLHCNELQFHGSLIRCFFAQIMEQRPEDEENRLLKLPELEKQFLISPPASPPVGWEPSRENEPIISFDLFSKLTAIAGNGSGPLEVHPRNDSCPAIVVHTCEDDIDGPVVKPKIAQTKRPEPVVTK